MKKLQWSIGPEEYLGKEGVTHRSIWWLYTAEQHPVQDKDGKEYKISQFADDDFTLWIGTFYPYNEIDFEKSCSTLSSAQKYGELLYLTNNK
jgi:hypothetical protein